MDEINLAEEIIFHIQDEQHVVKAAEIAPETNLNDYLRNTLHLTGTKSMCYEGGCGSCVVCVQIKDNIYAVNSCLVSIFSCHGWKIYTIEGIGNSKTGYHPIQKALAAFNGTQCGFCSPGMVMNMYALYQKNTKIAMSEVENSFSGNICRCTGYRPILAAFKSLSDDASVELLGQCPDIEDLRNCCRQNGCGSRRRCVTTARKETIRYDLGKSTWIKMFTLESLLSVLKKYVHARYMLVCGNTARGVHPFVAEPQVYLDITDVAELSGYQLGNDKLVIGGNTTLTNAIKLFYQTGKSNAKFSYLTKVADHIDLIANVPVRNIGTLAGNLMIKYNFNDFPSDIFILCETIGATLTIVDTDGNGKDMSPNNFLSYNMKGKVIRSITIPARDASFKYESYKIMPRAQNAHALVNAGFLVQMNDHGEVQFVNIVYGNVKGSFVHATKTEQYLKDKYLFDDSILQTAFQYLDQEIKPDYVLPDAAPEFRKQLAIALFYKFVLSIAPENAVSPSHKSGGKKFRRPVSTGVQDFSTNKSLYPLTQPVIKTEALAQTSGEAQYLYDMPDVPGQLFASFVLANARARSVIKSINASKALKEEGVVAFIDKKDIPGRNTFTPKEANQSGDEEIFCSGTVLYYSQPIGVIVAKSQKIADKAAEMVEITYEMSKIKPLLTVRDILKANAKDRIIHERTITPKRKGTDIQHVIKGKFDIGWQYHFSMETQYCSVVPTEDGLDMFTSTQWMDINQAAAAAALNVPANKINISVRRLGGAYGAKISRNSQVSSAVAVAAHKLNKPVKMMMNLEANMMAIGKRYPCSCDYEVGVNADGEIQYLNNVFYTDSGRQGGNESSMRDILELFTSSYVNDTWYISGNSTRSDCPTGTWCRAPGTTEGLTMIESIMEHIAYSLNIDPIEVRLANMDKDKHPKLLYFMSEFKSWANIDARKKDIAEFNQKNRWTKKGIAVVPMAYGFQIFGSWNVLVSIYQADGTVAVSHGGIEMGQGINTKVAQVCAYALGIPLETVSVKPSNNLVAPNAMFSGGSITSEAVCFGALQACQQLLDRIKPYKEIMPKATWPQLIKKCYAEFVDLTATYMYNPREPSLKSYTIYGVCATEVEIDILTGVHQIIRADVLEDTGNSMSPNIDIGQVEGAYVMGQGYWTTEQIITNEDGKILTNRTWNYRPPGAKDIPIDFRVKFPKNNPNSVGVLKSKATAEPPLCMSCSIPLAIRNAVASARLDANKNEPLWYPFDGPSTVENTFMNCLNNYKDYVL